MAGDPLVVDSVDLPGDGRLVQFGGTHILKPAAGGQSSEMVAYTEVTDLWGFKWIYQWGTPHESRWTSVSELLPKASTLFFPSLTRRCDDVPNSGVTYRYDPLAGFALKEVEEQSGRKVVFSYEHPRGTTSSTYTAPGAAAQRYNSKMNFPSASTDIQGRVTTYGYTAQSRLPRITKDHRGRVVEISYDEISRVTSVKTWSSETSPGVYEGLLSEVSMDYHPVLKGVPIRVTRKASGLLTGSDPEWVEPLVSSTQIDSAGLGWSERTGYDANGDGDFDDPGDLATSTQRSAAGRVLSVAQADGGTTSLTYDARGLVERIQFADGSSMSMQHDKSGRSALVTDPMGYASGTIYDVLGRPVATVKDMNGNLSFSQSAGLQGIDAGTDVISRVDHLDLTAASPAKDRQIQITDPDGYIRKVKLDPFGRTIRTIGPKGNRAPGYIPTEADDIVQSIVYDELESSSGPVQMIDPKGFETLFRYDDFGRLEQVLKEYQKDQSPLYQGTRFGYHETSGIMDRTTAIRTPLNPSGAAAGGGAIEALTTKVVHDLLDRPELTIEAEGTSREIRRRTSYTSTGLAWKTEVRDRLAGGGNPERWVATESRYDAMGRMVKQLLPEVTDESTGTVGRPSSEIVYDRFGRVGGVKDAYGNTVEYGYDIRGGLIYKKDPASVDALTGTLREPVTRYLRDRVGRVAEILDPLGRATNVERDAAGRLRAVMAPELMEDFGWVRAVTTYEHDLRGNLSKIIDPEGNLTYFGYDALGQVVSTRTPVSDRQDSGAITVSDVVEKMIRDERGQVIRVEDGLQQATGFSYDGLGRQTARVVDPDHSLPRTSRTLYDAMLPVASIDAKAQRIDYEYDERFALEDLVVAGSPLENLGYSYDDLGRLKAVTQAGSTVPSISYSYDLLGRLESELSNGVTQFSGYDLNGRVAKLTSSANGRSLEVSRDALGRMKTVTDSLGGLESLTSFGYDLAGNPVRQAMANGLNQTAEFDAMGRQTKRALVTAGGDELSRSELAYDFNSNVTKIADYGIAPGSSALGLQRTLEMRYDEKGQLVYESNEDGEHFHRYDKASNRISTARIPALPGGGFGRRDFVYGGLSHAGTLLNSNQLNEVTDFGPGGIPTGGATWFEYDANGSRISKTSGGGAFVDTYGYDRFGRLSQLEVESGTAGGIGTYHYAYDALSRRIGRETPDGKTTRFAFRGSSPVYQWNEPAVPGPAPELTENIGGGVGGRLYSYHGPNQVFPFHNHRGDVSSQSNAGGSITYSARYSADGLLKGQNGSRVGGYGANSKWEEPTGLVDDGFRFRDADLGVFVGRDPAGFIDGLNDYNYVRHNPWSSYDPNGLDDESAGGRSVGYISSPPSGTGSSGLTINGLAIDGPDRIIPQAPWEAEQLWERLAELRVLMDKAYEAAFQQGLGPAASQGYLTLSRAAFSAYGSGSRALEVYNLLKHDDGTLPEKALRDYVLRHSSPWLLPPDPDPGAVADATALFIPQT